MTIRLEAQTCDFYEGVVAFNSEGGNQGHQYRTRYFLVDEATSTISYISDSAYFEYVDAGQYKAYAVNYHANLGIIGLNVNQDFDDVRSLCSDLSAPLDLKICSVPTILNIQNDEIEVCLDSDLPISGPDIIFEENDGDSLEIHLTIASGGDPLHDTLDVDLSAFSNAIKSYNYPTLIISADPVSSVKGIAPSDARSILQTLQLTGVSNLEGSRTIEVSVFDPFGNQSNVVTFDFNAFFCSDCSYIIATENDVRFQEDCRNPYDYCLSILQDSAYKYDIYDNGVLINDIGTCFPDTFILYSVMSLIQETGPFEVVFWDVGSQTFKATFDSLSQLAMYMDAWDVLGAWAYNTTNQTIGGLSNRPTYGDLEIVQVATGKTWSITPNMSIQRNDFISLPLSVGNHKIIITDRDLQCSDTLNVDIVCDDAVSYVPEFISLFDTIQVGQQDSINLDPANLNIIGVYNDCEPSSGEFVRFAAEQTWIKYKGIDVGLDSFCVVACGPIGDCDTTTLFVQVIPEILDPIARNDTSSTLETNPVAIEILLNDSLNNGSLVDIFILDDPQYGAVSLDRARENIAEYQPKENFCGYTDSFSYVIVNEVGQDTAMVMIDMACDSLRVLNGFSPNGDGINDVFVILGIEKIEENRVRAYNRWGNMVFSKERYRNQTGWDGTWKGQTLPDGTYFYTIEDKARRIIRSGWVQIYRG